MKAIGYQQNLPISDALSLQDIELPEPHAKGHDLLVEVQAVSVNPVDAKIRQGVPAAKGEWKVVGWDATGIVKAVGPDVTLFKPGDKVWYAGDISRSGSYAELQLVDERIVGHMPESLSFADAAALPLTSITAWEMLFDRLQVEVGKAASRKSIMIIGAAGGVGSIMVQLAARLTNLTIIGTASRPETTVWLKELGAHHVLDHSKPLSQELKRAGLPLVDYVVSLNNTESHYAEIIDCLIPQGKFGLIDDPENLNAVPLKTKAISLHWELMFTRSLFQTPDMQSQHDLLNQVAALIDSGLIKSTVGQHYGQINATNLKRAHAVLEAQTAKGKIVLEGF